MVKVEYYYSYKASLILYAVFHWLEKSQTPSRWSSLRWRWMEEGIFVVFLPTTILKDLRSLDGAQWNPIMCIIFLKQIFPTKMTRRDPQWILLLLAIALFVTGIFLRSKIEISFSHSPQWQRSRLERYQRWWEDGGRDYYRGVPRGTFLFPE